MTLLAGKGRVDLIPELNYFKKFQVFLQEFRNLIVFKSSRFLIFKKSIVPTRKLAKFFENGGLLLNSLVSKL
jgi:hypothetical protein